MIKPFYAQQPEINRIRSREIVRSLLKRSENNELITDTVIQAHLEELWNSSLKIGEMICKLQSPIPMRLPCPSCGKLHIDEGEFATKPHHSHACQFCGMVWRPALVDTVGVQFLPGFKNES